jgi:3,2-trans-enoyl-CoA isomerase
VGSANFDKIKNMNTLKIEYKENYAIVQLDNGKVNAINTELAKELGEAFRLLEADDNVKGVILTGRPHAFSAGLDIMSMAGGLKIATEFWQYYLDALQVMIRFPKPFVCAITGYAPAGGTILACCADYRIMGIGEKHVIGMHEFKMSLPIPELLSRIYAYTIGERMAWKSVLNARLYNAESAKAIGLVDETAVVEDVLALAEQRLEQYMKVYLPMFAKTKRYLRRELLTAIDMDIPEMIKEIVVDFNDPKFVTYVAAFLQSLKSK